MVFERHGVAHQSKDDACVPDQVGQEQVDGHPAGRDVVVCVWQCRYDCGTVSADREADIVGDVVVD